MSESLAEERLTVVDIAIEARSGGGEGLYTYQTDALAQEGDAFFVPLGTRSVLGFAVRSYHTSPDDLGFPVSQLRKVHQRIDGLTLPGPICDLMHFVANEYLCSLSVALGPVSPPGLSDRLVSAWTLIDLAGEDAKLTAAQSEVIQVLRESGGTLYEGAGKKIAAGTLKALKMLRAKGLVRQSLRLAPSNESRETLGMLQLTPDNDRIERFMEKSARKKPAQALTVMQLQSAESTRLTAAEIKAMCGVTDATVRALVEAGLLERVEEDAPPPRTPPNPNRAQQIAIDAIVDAVHASRFQPFLLYGVTGSGKTEVYLRAASEALRQGRQVLYLVPEIALATQAIAHLRERFGRSVAIVHSDLPAKERLDNWIQIREGRAPVVLGARSALFAPLSNIGLIIVDEEHESTYKQESSPRYHAKRLAMFLAKKHNAALVLGSATPSVESFYEAEIGSLTQLSLPERAASATLPTVFIDNLADGFKTGAPSMFAQDLQERIRGVIDRKQQAILFLNRRAYSAFLLCRDCGQQFMCPRCAVSLSYSQTDRNLRCHHCGYNTRPPEVCPACNGYRIKPIGAGTEKVEESVKNLFPDARVARLDRDVAQKRGALESILTSFRTGDLDILVGTQMIAKGLDFPRVTLVGVIVADTSLNIPDFRASERTFQLLSQVAGRAGRGKIAGNVVIQTFNPLHISVVTAQTHDYVALYEAVKAERRAAKYPPFVRLVNVVLSGTALGEVKRAADDAADALHDVDGAFVLGPTSCPLERLQGKWRQHVLVKLPPETNLGLVRDAMLGLKWKNVAMTVDVDPYSLM